MRVPAVAYEGATLTLALSLMGEGKNGNLLPNLKRPAGCQTTIEDEL